MVFIYRIGPFRDVGSHVAGVFSQEFCEFVRGVACRGRAFAGPLVEELQDELAKRLGDIVREHFRLEFHLEDVFAGLFEVLAAEEVFADEHFAGDDAHAEQIAGIIDFFAHDLLGTHVGCSADDATGLREFLADVERRFGVGDAKVQEAYASVLVDHHVRGFQVAVRDAVAVGVA